jgi:23S rRNA pseudouridine2605 synthase
LTDPDGSHARYRLNRFLARAGIASRRKSDQLIMGGMVQVNGRTVTEPGFRVGPEDNVTCMGRTVELQPQVTAALNKPHGYETTLAGDHPRSILMLMKGLPSGTVPVGRLDVNTGGLLLLSNDGELVNRLTHPSWEVEREYRIFLESAAGRSVVDRLARGAVIGNGEFSRPESVRITGPSSINVVLHTGRNREVRRLCDASGISIKGLERVRYGPISISGISRGEYRLIIGGELDELRRCVDL